MCLKGIHYLLCSSRGFKQRSSSYIPCHVELIIIFAHSLLSRVLRIIFDTDLSSCQTVYNNLSWSSLPVFTPALFVVTTFARFPLRMTSKRIKLSYTMLLCCNIFLDEAILSYYLLCLFTAFSYYPRNFFTRFLLAISYFTSWFANGVHISYIFPCFLSGSHEVCIALLVYFVVCI